MKGNKGTVLTLAQICKNIMASNWRGYLNTIKADAKGSKEDIYTSKVKYILKKGRPYIWVPEKDLHNVNTVIDERGSFAIASPYPGPLRKLLKSLNKLPARVALTGDVVPLENEKAQLAAKALEKAISSEQTMISNCTYTVSGILSSSNLISTSRSANLMELLDMENRYRIYRFTPSSYTFIDGHGRTYDVDPEDFEKSKAGSLASLSAKIIDGVNQSEARRKALILFCLTHFNANARDAYMQSIDLKGFDVLGKVGNPAARDGIGEYQWKEFRFNFKEEACDVETFCCQLVEMEEEALKKVSGYSGLT